MTTSDESNPKPYFLRAGEGVPGFGSDTKAAKASTGGLLTLIESRTTGGAPMHVHTHEDECFYIVEGTITVTCGDETFEAGPRSFVYLPRGVPHGWDVVGEEATLLMITVPGMLEEFLHEFHAVPWGEARNEVATKYGVTFLKNQG
jgi:mannose-6-phosphate isomerase-like protein (cupin superfamily)